MLKDRKEQDYKYHFQNFQKIDHILKGYEEFDFIIPKNRMKSILINQLKNLLKSLLEEKIDINIIYYFLQDSIQIARYFSDKDSQDILERFAYEIVDYNQKAFLKLSSSTEDFSTGDFSKANEFKSKYIISPIINSDWIPTITNGETIKDFLNKMTTAGRLSVYIHNQLFRQMISKLSIDSNVINQKQSNFKLFIRIFSEYFINRAYYMKQLCLLASHNYLFVSNTSRNDIFDSASQSYSWLFDNIRLNPSKYRFEYNRIYHSIIICSLCNDKKNITFFKSSLRSYYKNQISMITDSPETFGDSAITLIDDVGKIDISSLKKIYHFLYPSTNDNNANSINQKMNDWLEEKYEGILKLKLDTLGYLEFFINKKHSVPKQIEDFLFRYSTDLFQEVPWKATNSDYENYKIYISIQTNLIKKNRVMYERIIDIFIKNKKKMKGRVFNFLLISQLLNPIPRENKQSQFLLSTLLKKLATEIISDNQYFFKEIINNLLQAISSIPDPSQKEEMLSLLYASIWDYDKDFIKELGEFSKPENQHHNIDKEILKEITNLAAIAIKAEKGLDNLSDDERLLYYQSKFNSKEYDFKEWFDQNYKGKSITLPKDFNTDYFVDRSLVSDKNIFYKLAAFEMGGVSIDSDFILEQILASSPKEIFSEIYQDFHQLRRYMQIKNTSNIMKKVVWQSINRQSNNNRLKLPWTSLLILDDSNTIETFKSEINDFHKFITYKLLEPGYYTSKPLEFKNIFMKKLIKALNDYKEDVEDPIRTYIENVDSSLIKNDKIGIYEKKLLHKKLTYLIHSHYGIGSEE